MYELVKRRCRLRSRHGGRHSGSLGSQDCRGHLRNVIEMGPRRRELLAVWWARDLIGEQQLGHVSSAGRGYTVEASSGPASWSRWAAAGAGSTRHGWSVARRGTGLRQ